MHYSLYQLTFVTIFFMLSLLLPNSNIAQGFLSVNGKRIVDAQGNEVILRGHSPGGWMLQEGYMLQMEAFANPQHQIRAKIEELIGPEQTALFYEKWLANHFTRADFDLLKDMGFNSIRLPMHYNLFTLPIEDEPVAGQNTWLEKGFAMVDTLLAWCTEQEIYLILDMHAAPGGQGRDAAISDYDASKPSLWESELNKDKLVALWRQLAQRYADEPWLGGYDLINEPNWNFTGSNPNGCNENTNAPLRQLYGRITEAIREVDTNHIIIIEGNCWGNNHNGLTPPWDDKLVYSFHKYWSSNDPGSIQWMINLRNTHNVPIWCGESGENSNHWYTDAVRLMEENNIGWAWWTWKKFDSFSGIASVQPPEGYQTLKNYWQNGGTQPTAEFATAVLMELAERLKLEHCLINYPVADALLRQPGEGSAMPFATHTLPGMIFATDFDMGQNGIAYLDEVYQNTHVTTGNYTAWNTGWAYRNDGVDIESCSDIEPSNGFNVGWTSPGEWMQYTVDVDETAGYSFSVRYASNGSTMLRIKINEHDVLAPVSLPSTGGWQNWQTFSFPDMIINSGENVIKVVVSAGGGNLSHYSFTDPKPVSEIPFNALMAETTGLGDTIALVLNFSQNQASSLSSSDFNIQINGEPVMVHEVIAPTPDSRIIFIISEERIYYNDQVKISYTGASIIDELNRPLEPFSNLSVLNQTPYRHILPGTVQVEDYYHQYGLVFESAEDTGGGSNFGYTDPGDYADYYVKINQAGTYEFSYRIAALAANGKFRIQLYHNDTMTPHGTFSVPATGGWQSWQTINSVITLPEGYYKLRVYIVSKEFNMNWFRVGNLINSIDSRDNKGLLIYPNPASDYFIISTDGLTEHFGIEIFNFMGQKVYSTEARQTDFIRLNVSDWPAGPYIVRLTTGNHTSTSKVIVKSRSVL